MEENNTTEDSRIDNDRIHIQNLPQYMGYQQFKKLLQKSLGSIKLKKVRQLSENAYVSFETSEDAQKSIQILNGLQIKQNVLSAKLAQSEPRKYQPRNQMESDKQAPVKIKTAKESVTPLAHVSYEEQLKLKDSECEQLFARLCTAMKQANIAKFQKLEVLKQIKPSPKIRHYRNKCEFTVGRTVSNEIVVGFVGGRFSENQHYVMPLEDVDNITNHCKSIAKEFEKFVIDSGLPPFNEFDRCGVWKMLTIREFSGDVMIIVTTAPLADEAQEANLKEKLVKELMDLSTFEEKSIRITSIYWQIQENSSDPVKYEHIAGVPYIYETVLDCRFRVSPAAFFQTNSQAASVLYTTIGDACGFIEGTSTDNLENVDDIEPAAKKIKIESDVSEDARKRTILLDICCGTGTIGQCLIKKYNMEHNIFCIGIEIIKEAVEDAKQNAKDNGLQNIKYAAGKAEDVFRNLKYYLPLGVTLDNSEVIGVLDPPRAGMHEKVILGCREMAKMKKLIFVSCDPAAAMKNIVDLCRPESKKFSGTPFSLTAIQPVDMFPQTKHFEWVITLIR